MTKKDNDDYLEWVVEKDFVETLERAGWLCLKGDKVKRGFADQFCFGPGPRTIIVEFKKLGAKPRRGEKLQAYYREEFRKMNYEVYKITGKAEAQKLSDSLLGIILWD